MSTNKNRTNKRERERERVGLLPFQVLVNV
jgi:hypothetical protein